MLIGQACSSRLPAELQEAAETDFLYQSEI
jgi:hypothetical protein